MSDERGPPGPRFVFGAVGLISSRITRHGVRPCQRRDAPARRSPSCALVCPKSKQPLDLLRADREAFLLCPASRLQYRIEDGVPVLLVEEADGSFSRRGRRVAREACQGARTSRRLAPTTILTFGAIGGRSPVPSRSTARAEVAIDLHGQFESRACGRNLQVRRDSARPRGRHALLATARSTSRSARTSAA